MLKYLPDFYSKRAIVTYLALLVAIQLAFSSSGMPLLWVGFGIAEVAGFFWFATRFTRAMAGDSNEVFRKNLFTTALVLRVVYVVAVYFFYLLKTGQPFEFEAADSVGYHEEALMMVDWVKSGDFFRSIVDYREGVSDLGNSLWMTIVYLISYNSIIVFRISNAILGAYTVVFIYRLARRNFGEEAARISAVFAMLLPTLIFYCGLHTKETVMVFLLTAFAERADHMLRTKGIHPKRILVVVALGLSLFFFRTVLAVSAWFALFSAILFSSNRIIGSARRLSYAVWIIAAALFVFSGRILTEVEFYISTRLENQQQHLDYFASRDEGGNAFARYGSASVFLPLVLLGPLPSMVNTYQDNAMMIHGANVVRVIYVFFVLLALYLLYKERALKNHVLILVLMFSYLFVLALSGFALSERFHMPAVPFLLILAGYGVSRCDRKNVKYYIPYLIFAVVLILGWNWFKLAGRGII